MFFPEQANSFKSLASGQLNRKHVNIAFSKNIHHASKKPKNLSAFRVVLQRMHESLSSLHIALSFQF